MKASPLTQATAQLLDRNSENYLTIISRNVGFIFNIIYTLQYVAICS